MDTCTYSPGKCGSLVVQEINAESIQENVRNEVRREREREW